MLHSPLFPGRYWDKCCILLCPKASSVPRRCFGRVDVSEAKKPSKQNSFRKGNVCVPAAHWSRPYPLAPGWPRQISALPPSPPRCCVTRLWPQRRGCSCCGDPGWGVKPALGLATGTVIAAHHATSRHTHPVPMLCQDHLAIFKCLSVISQNHDICSCCEVACKISLGFVGTTLPETEAKAVLFLGTQRQPDFPATPQSVQTGPGLVCLSKRGSAKWTATRGSLIKQKLEARELARCLKVLAGESSGLRSFPRAHVKS